MQMKRMWNVEKDATFFHNTVIKDLVSNVIRSFRVTTPEVWTCKRRQFTLLLFALLWVASLKPFGRVKEVSVVLLQCAVCVAASLSTCIEHSHQSIPDPFVSLARHILNFANCTDFGHRITLLTLGKNFKSKWCNGYFVEANSPLPVLQPLLLI